MRRALLAAVAATLLLTGTVMAGTQSVSGRASANKRLELHFTTAVAGDLVGTATFTPKGTTSHLLSVDTSADTTNNCTTYFDNRVHKVSHEVTITCTVPNAPAGDYYVVFYPGSGWVDATIFVTTPE